MTLSVLSIIMLILASFRLTRLLVFDTITEFIRNPFLKLKEEELEDGTVEEYYEIEGGGIKKFMGELLSCYWCTGIWSTAIVYVSHMAIPNISFPIIMILAIAGGASILEAIVSRVINE